MNIVHTSDWHLGHTLYGRKRHEEFQLFLDWLHTFLQKERVDLLLVSGDIFDSGAPGTRSQELYYEFLHKVSENPGCSIVITAGNHDSPSFLEAPKELLRHLNIHVIGKALTPDKEVIEIPGKEGEPGALVCAVPFLRDRDLYKTEEGDVPEERERKSAEGLREHFRLCAEEAERKRAGRNIPILAMGHLFVQGGRLAEGGTEARVGSLARIETGVFPSAFDYVALGHLHIPQQVGGEARLRYSGSPLPMDFSESANPKSLCLLRTQGREVHVETREIPRFQKIFSLRGDWPELERGLQALSNTEETWVEVLYTGREILADLHEKVLQAAPPKALVLRIRNMNQLPLSMRADENHGHSLEELTEEDVFASLLNDAGLCGEGTDEQRRALTGLHDEILQEIKQGAGEGN